MFILLTYQFGRLILAVTQKYFYNFTFEIFFEPGTCASVDIVCCRYLIYKDQFGFWKLFRES